MTRHLDDDLLRDFMHTFYGYGDYDAPYWFVGMEEASSGTVAEITRRLTLWDERGRCELEHLADWHLDPGPHPVSFGTPNAYFHRIGKTIAADR